MQRRALAALLLLQAVCAVHYEIQGFLTQHKYDNVNDVETSDVAQIIRNEVTSKLKGLDLAVLSVKEMGAQIGMPTINFMAELSVDDSVQRDDIVKVFSDSQRMGAMLVRQKDSRTKVVEEESNRVSRAAVATVCLNGGTQMADGSCICPAFVSGTKCEVVNCQHYSIPDGNRCYCPPGYNAKYCESRANRPALSEDFNLQKRSLIIVMSSIPSMSIDKQTVALNIKETVRRLQDTEPGYIDNYIGIMVAGVAGAQVMATATEVTDDIDKFVSFFVDGVPASPIMTTDEQPILLAVQTALQMTKTMHSHPIVLVFADRGDIMGMTAEKTNKQGVTVIDNVLTKISLIWNSKIFFFITHGVGYDINTNTSSYDVYRRVARNTHGDLVYLNKTDLQAALLNYVSKLYKPELINLRSSANCINLELPVNRDSPNQQVILTVSQDWNKVTQSVPSNLIVVNTNGQATLVPDSEGQLWGVYKIPIGWTSVKILSTAPVTCNARMFVSSDQTVISSFTVNKKVDGLDATAISAYPMFLTSRLVQLSNTYAASVRTHDDTTGTVLTTSGVATRQSQDWTFGYQLGPIPACDAGPYMMSFTISLNTNQKMLRLKPSFCFDSVLPPPFANAIAEVVPVIAEAVGSCTSKNNAALNDQRLRDYSQVIFAVENSVYMNSSISALQVVIQNAVGIISTDTVTRQFTLLTFDFTGVTNIISTYDSGVFVNKMNDNLSQMMSRMSPTVPVINKVFSLEAIWESTQLIINGPATLHLFTTAQPAGNSHNWMLPRNLQVNWYFISPDSHLPVFHDINTMQKQSGGRILALNSGDVMTLSSTLVNALKETSLVLDKTAQFADQDALFTFTVESGTTSVELNLLGTDVQVISLLDGANQLVDLNPIGYTFKSKSSIVMKIAVRPITKLGQWTIQVKSTGQCSAQVRLESDIKIMVGFSSNQYNDAPASIPYSVRGTNKATYASFRVLDVSGTHTIKLDYMLIGSTNVDQPWVDPIGQMVNITQYDPNNCAYQFRTNVFQMPTSTNVQLILYGHDEAGITIKRVFNYYTPNPTTTVCIGNSVNIYGECVCNGGYSGEFCDQPDCKFGATNSYGVCICADGYVGDLCQIAIVAAPNRTLTTTLAPPPATTRAATGLSLPFLALALIAIIA